ncbi:hypothetical protein [Nocardioides limicola]|uniref:hypothetical protein n=1 Tax=Nocardioides limicola TaxID=2803368 RepID=UPI00193B4581|nr:hypothetical protein [Nocardioides sp. DJM-14]
MMLIATAVTEFSARRGSLPVDARTMRIPGSLSHGDRVLVRAGEGSYHLATAVDVSPEGCRLVLADTLSTEAALILLTDLAVSRPAPGVRDLAGLVATMQVTPQHATRHILSS